MNLLKLAMKNIIIGLLNYVQRRRFKAHNSLSIGEGSILDFRRIRCDRNNNKLIVGDRSSMACSIVFEKGEGVISVGRNTFIGNSSLICADGISIGSNVQIAWGCTFLDHNSHSLDYRVRARDLADTFSGKKNWKVVDMRPIEICDDVWIGFNSLILKGVIIGRGAIVAAGSVVVKDVPPFVVVAGSPAKIVKKLPEA